jgi:hypothetical protein
MRSAVDQAKTAANQGSAAYNMASDSARKYGAAGDDISTHLIPGLEREAANPQGFTPEEMNDQLVASEQGAGGANAGITGEANLRAARTRNSAGYTAALDEAARDKTRTLSDNALNIRNQSAKLGQEKQMAAQKELGGLYGTDVEANLKAQGLLPEDVNAESNAVDAEAKANSTGWFQNMTGLISSLSGIASKAAFGKDS